MKEVVSKTGKIAKNADEIYPFLADFRNLSSIIPEDKIKDWNASEDECHFRIEGVGKAGMKIVEKEPAKLVKLTSSKETQFDFNIWIQLKQVEEKDTRVRITLRASLNPFMAAMVSKHLQKGVDTIVDKLTEFFNNR